MPTPILESKTLPITNHELTGPMTCSMGSSTNPPTEHHVKLSVGSVYVDVLS